MNKICDLYSIRYPLVMGPGNAFVAVTRHVEGDVLVWNLFPMTRVTRMRWVEG